VAVILGPLGLNFGSGMTGGWLMCCVPKRGCASPRFRTLAELASDEESWLRRTLEEHILLHGKPSWRSLSLTPRGIAVDARPAGSFSGHG